MICRGYSGLAMNSQKLIKQEIIEHNLQVKAIIQVSESKNFLKTFSPKTNLAKSHKIDTQPDWEQGTMMHKLWTVKWCTSGCEILCKNSQLQYWRRKFSDVEICKLLWARIDWNFPVIWKCAVSNKTLTVSCLFRLFLRTFMYFADRYKSSKHLTRLVGRNLPNLENALRSLTTGPETSMIRSSQKTLTHIESSSRGHFKHSEKQT